MADTFRIIPRGILLGCLCLLQLCSAYGSQDVVCPNGFVRYKRSCYKFSTMPASWLDAQGYCHIMGGNLLTIDDHHEQKWVVHYIKHHPESYPSSFWIGGNDLANEGEWKWVAAMKTVSYQNWHRYQPDNGRNREHCMEMEMLYNYKWNDQPCHMMNHFICEIIVY